LHGAAVLLDANRPTLAVLSCLTFFLVFSLFVLFETLWIGLLLA
jgi:hypothetical protein